MKKRIYNIPLSCSFVDVLANKYLEEFEDKALELSEVLFLLPNRRACNNLREAFVRAKGMQPTLLPKIMPIGDVDEEEVFFSGFDIDTLKELSPAISRTERQLIFTRMIMTKPDEFGVANISSSQACFLAKELSSLIDMSINEGLSFDKLKDLVPDEYAAHWQETLKFLKIITEYWPKILDERGGLKDPSFRHNQLLEIQSEIWKKNPPKNRIVIAGTTAAFPVMKKLVARALELDNCEVVLSGLDKTLEESAWEKIEESHPQFELKGLLDYLEVSRFEIEDYVSAQNEARERLLSEVMRPAVSTPMWREIKDKNFAGAFNQISFVDCGDIREEALTIALMMRENLEVSAKTTALVTSDRNLARRVANELERWNVKVDDSAGKPLSLTPVGQFLRLVLRVVEDDFKPISFLALLKHPFMACGFDISDFRYKIREYEKIVLRKEKSVEELEKFVENIKAKFETFYGLFGNKKASARIILEAHIELLEQLAKSKEKDGAKVLWRGEDGEACAKFVSDLMSYIEILGDVELKDYAGVLNAMMSSVTVRPRYGMHPRLRILGPIEARLVNFDTVIVGEVNEGIWPKLSSSDPWLSRPMKKDFGMPLPEKAIGVMAHDFCSLLSANEVFVVRANRVQGTPMLKSRWWMRMETVLSALGIELDSLNRDEYKYWARFLDRADVLKKISAPAPVPPVSARPRELPVSAIENLMRDPYMIFAKYILKLKKLDEVDEDMTMADYGNIIHAILEKFNKEYCREFPLDARERLLAIGEEYFRENKVAAETRAFWWPNFLKTVDWLVEKESSYRDEVAQVYSEVKGSYSFDAPAGEFVLTAKADRVDLLKDGKICVIDYKTGQAKSKKEIRAGYAPQLPLEALIANNGGFLDIGKKETKALKYWRLAKEEIVVAEDIDEVVSYNEKNLKELIAVFDFETTGYLSRPNPFRAPKYSDYDHLARVKEWSVVDEEDE